ncbi:MAG: glycosyltransferase family 39 protein, partial [Chitinophagaceae bacterium]|nr:glycosyltransferase family 39 protein [Anaerolineae bacterium]
MAQDRTSKPLLALIILTYLAVGGLYALRTPDWQTPDEPAHYNYTRQLVESGKVPMIESGDWDQAYLGELTSSRFAPETLANLDTVQYEDHQPPFYYMLAAPVYALSNGDLTALRLFSVLIGLIILVSAYGIGKAMFPERSQIGLGAAAFVAFLPQHVAFLAAANNDALGWALVALMLWGTVVYLKQDLSV